MNYSRLSDVTRRCCSMRRRVTIPLSSSPCFRRVGSSPSRSPLCISDSRPPPLRISPRTVLWGPCRRVTVTSGPRGLPKNRVILFFTLDCPRPYPESLCFQSPRPSPSPGPISIVSDSFCFSSPTEKLVNTRNVYCKLRSPRTVPVSVNKRPEPSPSP